MLLLVIELCCSEAEELCHIPEYLWSLSVPQQLKDTTPQKTNSMRTS
jgi:hypothetical protein